MAEAYTYILECKDGSLYTGWTNDLTRRVKAHNEGARREVHALAPPSPSRLLRVLCDEGRSARARGRYQEAHARGKARLD